MSSRQWGFLSSVRLLTYDAGWLKPLAILALVAWVPVIGPIVVFGYGFEWARLAAWGVPAAPRQHGVDMRKVLTTGVRVFGVFALMTLIAVLVLRGICGLDTYRLIPFIPLNAGSVAWRVSGPFEGVTIWVVLGVVLGLLLGTFMMVAMMRAVVYDRFAAAWRLDRVVQMIARDPMGFLKMWAAVVAGAALAFAYAFAGLVLFGAGVVEALLSITQHGVVMINVNTWAPFVVQEMSTWGVGSLLLAGLALAAAAFGYLVLSVAVQLVSINVCGQWFALFSVERWGSSGDPLPEGVPCRGAMD